MHGWQRKGWSKQRKVQDMHGSGLRAPSAAGQVPEVPSWLQNRRPPHNLHLVSTWHSARERQQACLLPARWVLECRVVEHSPVYIVGPSAMLLLHTSAAEWTVVSLGTCRTLLDCVPNLMTQHACGDAAGTYKATSGDSACRPCHGIVNRAHTSCGNKLHGTACTCMT
jgi:hypothetical protein